MTLDQLITAGAAITYTSSEPWATSILAPVAKIEPGRVTVWDLAADREHVIEFDGMDWPHDLGVKLINKGRMVAYVTYVTEEEAALQRAYRDIWTGQSAEEQARMTELISGFLNAPA